jgi:hypothetical protein
VAVLVVTRHKPSSTRGQIGPCLTDEAHRPLPERCSRVSRYAIARTLQLRSPRRIFAGGVMISPLPKGQRNCWPEFKVGRLSNMSRHGFFLGGDERRPDFEPEAVPQGNFPLSLAPRAPKLTFLLIGLRRGTRSEYCPAHQQRGRNMIRKNRHPFSIPRRAPLRDALRIQASADYAPVHRKQF